MKRLRVPSDIPDRTCLAGDQRPVKSRTVKQPPEGWPTVSDDVLQQGFYEIMRERGESHAIAEMLALRQVPGGVSDREFMHGDCNGNQFAQFPTNGDLLAKKYKQLTGRLPPKGAKYMGSLARFRADPEAWVSSRGEVKKLCEKRGWGADGMVKVKEAQPIGEVKKVKLADSIVNRRMKEELAKDPRQDKGELRHKIIQKHGNPYVKE